MMRLSTFKGIFWLPSATKNKVCVRVTSLFCVLTACLVMLFGCADPGTQKKSEEADTTVTQENQNRLIHGFVACGTVAERSGYFHS